MTRHPQGKQVQADLSWAAEQLAIPFRDELGITGQRLRTKGMAFLEAEMLDSGVIEQAGIGQLRFWHLTFQEHYAASALVELDDDDGPQGWWQVLAPHLGDRQWEEVLEHFAGCLARTGRRRLNLLVERILITAESGDLASLASAVGVLGRILRILTIYDYEPPQRLGWEQAKERVMRIFTTEGASQVPVNERIEAAEALGTTGDPRFENPEPKMLPIKGMPNVLLDKYPVTVADYRRFVESGGYNQPQVWGDDWKTKKDAGWTEPAGWDDQEPHSNSPVTGVSWYEAVAYCRWLIEYSGNSYRLPTSDEWQTAATNPKGDYPWGKATPNNELLNFDGNVGKPTPVGVYPAGVAPGGHLDLAGNVWEWIRDSDGTYRVIRGGSWNDAAYYCRSAIRYGYSPDYRSSDIGFRLARSITLGP